MRTTRLMLAAALTMTLGALAARDVAAQQAGQQEGEAMAMMQRVSEIEERANHLSEEMARHRERGQDQTMESHRAMERMDQSLAAMAKQLKGFIFDAQMMMQDEATMGDGAMRADMKSLHEYFASGGAPPLVDKCYSTCAMNVQEDNCIRRIEPHPGNRATPGGASLKGLGYVEPAHSPDRNPSPRQGLSL